MKNLLTVFAGDVQTRKTELEKMEKINHENITALTTKSKPCSESN